jgi:hypothetical protein
VTIKLTPELEQVIGEEARRQGTTPELLVIESLRRCFLPHATRTAPEPEGTLADFLSDFVGTLHSSEHVPGGARMSEAAGRKFAAGMDKKRRLGRL